MDLGKFYRALLVLGTLCYVVYWFLPYTYHLLPGEQQSILSYGGHAAIVQFPEVYYQIVFGGFVVSAIGMFLYRKFFRTMFLIMLVITTIVAPLHGFSVETAGGTMLLAITTMCDGAVLIMAFFTPVREKFY